MKCSCGHKATHLIGKGLIATCPKQYAEYEPVCKDCGYQLNGGSIVGLKAIQ